MKTIASTIVAVASIANIAAAQDIATRLDAYMRARESLGQFSGAVLVAKNGKVLLSKGYGYASFELAVPNSPATKFRAASITKQFTSGAILLLRDQGKLKLTDSLCDYVSDCPVAWKPVTLAHLIHHTSGIPDYEEELGLGTERYMAFMDSAASTQRILALARTKPLDFAPGAKFNYSNTGYILLAAVIERVTGQSFADYIEKQMLMKAGMSNSSIVNSSSFISGAAAGYTPGGDTPLALSVAGIPFLKSSANPVANVDMSGAHGDGALVTTVGDLMKWNSALEAGSVLSRAAVTEMFTPAFAADDSVKEDGYGFGWIISTRFSAPYQYHTGFIPGFASRIERYPDSGLFIIVMSNYDAVRLSRITRDLAAAALEKPYDVPRSHHIVELDSVTKAGLMGEYVMGNGTKAIVKPGTPWIEVQVPGRFTAGLLPESSTVFYAPFFEGTVEFKRDASGKGVSLNMHYDGIDRIARRQ